MSKANNRMTEPGGDTRPIFADSTRRYCYLSRVQRYRRVEGGARFSVLTNDDEEMVLDIRFVSPYVLRTRCYRKGEEQPVDGARGGAKAHVEAVAGKVIITSDALELRVVRRPFHYGVFHPKGKKLFVQQIGDVSGERLVSMPLGYSRGSDGRIAFHESFELQPDEHLFGPGPRTGALDRRGQRILVKSHDDGVPSVWSSRGYGLFVLHSAGTTWELGFPSTITASFRVEDAYLDYFLVFGDSPKDIFARYAGLSSK